MIVKHALLVNIKIDMVEQRAIRALSQEFHEKLEVPNASIAIKEGFMIVIMGLLVSTVPTEHIRNLLDRVIAVGKFAGAPRSTFCAICAPGKVAPFPGQNDCFDCPGGKYQDSIGKEFCRSCPAGTFSTGSSSTCTA